MGELEPWMDENFIKGVFLSATGETVNVKVIRDKNSGYVIRKKEPGERELRGFQLTLTCPC
jgi:hypothetical protein